MLAKLLPRPAREPRALTYRFGHDDQVRVVEVDHTAIAFLRRDALTAGAVVRGHSERPCRARIKGSRVRIGGLEQVFQLSDKASGRWHRLDDRLRLAEALCQTCCDVVSTMGGQGTQ